MIDTSDEDARHQVRRLLLSGDNTVKNRSDAERYERAGARYREARRLAVGSGLEPGVIAFIDRRLADLQADGDGSRSR